MHQIAIDTANAQALAMIPESCGAVTVGCTDVAGVVEAVIASSKSLRSEHEALAETVRALEADQTKVAEASDEAEALDTEIAANQQALEDAGHWGVPTLVFQGEPFFGQDRIAMAKWRMEQKGLQPR